MKKSILALIIILLASTAQAGHSKLLASRNDNYYNPTSSWVFYDSLLYFSDAQYHDTAVWSYYYSQHTWKLRAKEIYDYNSNGTVNDNYYLVNDTLTNQLRNVYIKITLGYNAAGDTNYYLYQNWNDVSGAYLNTIRLYDYYDAAHRDTARIIQKWVSSSWQNYFYDQYQYNGSGELITATEQKWNGTAYDPFYKFTYTYDANHHMTQQVYQLWNASTSAWENNYEYFYTWNSSGDNTKRLYNVWNTITSLYERDSSVYQSFSGTHKIVNQIYQLYNSNTVSYDNLSQYNYTYDANDNILASEKDTYFGGQWEHNNRWTYQYDAMNNKIYEIHEFYDNSVSMYQPDERTYYYYGLINTGVNEVPEMQQASLYPNPVLEGKFHLKFDQTQQGNVEVRIYDVEGRMVSREQRDTNPGENDLKIDLRELATGSYVISVVGTRGEKYTSMKMIKQ